MKKKSSFLQQFWKQKKMVGAMAPSSRFLANLMMKNIDFTKADVIVELGPGTGVFTKRILEKMHPNAVILAFELNDEFFYSLTHIFKDPRVHLIHDSAEKIEHYLTKLNLAQADIVVSSLPLAVFPPQLRDAVLDASYKSLRVNGNYVQFQYSLTSKKHIKRVFEKVSIDFTPFNFPPAFVYTCSKEN